MTHRSTTYLVEFAKFESPLVHVDIPRIVSGLCISTNYKVIGFRWIFELHNIYCIHVHSRVTRLRKKFFISHFIYLLTPAFRVHITISEQKTNGKMKDIFDVIDVLFHEGQK